MPLLVALVQVSRGGRQAGVASGVLQRFQGNAIVRMGGQHRMAQPVRGRIP